MVSSTLYILGAIIALGVMVTIHEFGHFLVARYFGVRVDVFSFGFGPRIVGIKRGDTDYRISPLPFGGYVKMAGDNISEERTGAPDEFLSKPRWQRVLIALAGPTMNILTALVIFAIYFSGTMQQPPYFDSPVVVAGVLSSSPADQAGIQPGDRIVAINGAENPTWSRAHWEAFFSTPGDLIPITIDRSGQTVSTSVRSTMFDYQMFGFTQESAVVHDVTAGQAAERAGLKPGDEILSVEGQPIQNPLQVNDIMQHREDKPTNIEISRGGHEEHLVFRASRRDPGDGIVRWVVGFSFKDDRQPRSMGFVDAIGFSAWFSTRFCEQLVHTLGQLFVGRASPKEFLGPIGIVTLSGRAARSGFGSLSYLMALISLNLGVLNLLPIPILDGGHIFVLAIEGALRHDLSMKAKERFIQVGFVFILVVFAFVMYNDVIRLFQHS